MGSGVCDLDGEGKRACGSRRAGDGARGAERKARRQRAAGERPSIRSRAARSRKSGAVRAGQGRTGKLRGGDLQGCRGGIDSESGDVARHATARIADHHVEERAIVGRRASGRRVGSGSGAADGRATLFPLIAQGRCAGGGHGESGGLARGYRLIRRLSSDRWCHGGRVHGQRRGIACGGSCTVAYNNVERRAAIRGGGRRGGVAC